MAQIDYDDPRHQAAAAAILQRHDNNEPEANITSAVRDFLLCTGLVDANEVAEEVVPSGRSVRQRTEVEQNFGPNSPLYRWDIDALNMLYQGAKDRETVRVKCRLWETLLRAALGEIAQTPDELDDLFVRHTYLSMVIGMVVQAYFGIDIRERAANDPTDLLYGRQFRDDTGLQDIIESDFFAWPAEVGGESLIERVAEHVARFNWKEAPPDIAATLYEAIIPPDERRQLGEYYTPEWLAQAMVQEVVTDPLRQRVLDPSCGSGTFIAVAVRHFVEAATAETMEPKEALERLREAVMGIDVHPVAVRLARTAWVMAARPLLEAAANAGLPSCRAVSSL